MLRLEPLKFDLRVSADGRATEIEVSGELDVHTAPKLQQAMLDALAVQPTRLTLNLAALTFLDATGMSVMILGLMRARGQGTEFRLSQVHNRTLRVLDLSGLDKVFEIQ
jgi:anti-sigma B factor antagonist